MTARILPRVGKLLGIGAAAMGMVAITASPALATDDTWYIRTQGQCGQVKFVDYGPGAAGGGNNDDYTTVSDLCADGDGVKAYAWLDGHYLGGKYNGNGNGTTVVWDPFGNVTGGQAIGLKICSVNGNDDSTAYNCAAFTKYSVDG